MQPKEKRHRKNTVLGLDLGSRSVKALEITRNGEKLAVTNCALADVAGPSTYADSVRAVLKAGDFRGGTVAIGVSGQGALLRNVTLQGDRVEDLDQAVRDEARALLRYDVDDALLDYHIDSQEHDRNITVLLAAARRNDVLKKVDMLDSIGVKPSIVDMELIALANAAETIDAASLHPKPGTPFCLVDFGAAKTLITVTDGANHFFREFPFGGQKLTEMLAHRLDCSPAEAETIKLDPGDRLDLVKDAIYPGIEDLTAEIRSCLTRFRNQTAGREAQQLFLSGGLVRFSGIVSLIGRTLGIESMRFNPFVALSSNDMDIAFLDANAHRFSIAFGLACHARN